MSEPAPPFIETKEYRRFVEFCEACRRSRYIGLCHGPPGVGKTLSARHYARWDAIEQVIHLPTFWYSPPQSPDLVDCRTVVFTPSMTTTPKRLEMELARLQDALKVLVEITRGAPEDPKDLPVARILVNLPRVTELVIVDEADRLTFGALEQLRDAYDRGGFSLVLLGMPGLDRRLARYPQFSSRVGFVHAFRPLSDDELRFLLERRWADLGSPLRVDEFDDVEAVSTIIRMTGGNFRLVQRLLAQIARIMTINQRQHVTKEIVEAARESLVIGTGG